MRTPIRLRCPACRARIKAPFQLLGKTRPCPQCRQPFTVQIQVPDDSGPILTDDLVSSPDEAKNKVILVADDDLGLNEGIRSVFENKGYQVLQAYNGVQATEMLRERNPDLLILDILMPRMGGFPVLESVHRRSQGPPVIMITAQEGSEYRAYAHSMGVVDFIRKPFALERLLESVAKNLTA